jgi:Zn-dependent M28 family amino/carboxypeptidase
MCLGIRDGNGSGFKVQGSRFGFKVQGSRFGFKVQGSGFAIRHVCSRRLQIALVVSLLLSGCLTAAQNSALPKFDGARAFKHLQQLVAIGPRPAGSAGAQKTRDYIKQQFSALGISVAEQAFDARTPVGIVRMVNLRALIPGSAAGPTLVVAGHYDTKLFHDITFVGANDGGSSAAFLIELARVLKARPAAGPIELLFLDGEEAVVEWQGDDNTYGSRYYVDAAVRDGTLKQIGALVLVDMIGDRNLRILRESQSTAWLTDILWRHARTLGRHQFVSESTAISDDHLPFLAAGVPAVDIIDLDYPAWHTAQDTLDKTSAESLQAVGDVLVAALPDIERHLRLR